MMNFKKAMMGSLIGAATLASPAAFAGATGNVGAFSEYMFRGVAQTGGASVQGGLDYAHDSGFYVGTWIANVGGAFGNSAETDFYGGFAGKVGDLGFDLGAIFYYYSEEEEVTCGTPADACEFNTFEFYGGLSYGPVGVKYYYSDEANFFIGDGDAEDAAYLLGTLALPISDSLNFTASVGFYDGDEIERVLVSEDSYTDYSVGLAKSIDGGMTFTLQLIDTDIDEDSALGVDDDPKFVVGFKKSFEL